MPPIVSIVGKSDSGKTTLLEALIKVLGQRGRRVAVIKHAADDFEIDTPDKDSWRFTQAGSAVSAISSKDRLAVIRRLENEQDPQALLPYVGADCDLVLTEGFKQYDCPKIEVIGSGQNADPVSPPEQLLAIVADKPINVSVPQFNKTEVDKIADLIEQKYLVGAEESVDLFANGRYVPLDRSARNLLLRTLMAIASGLKATERLKTLGVFMRRKT